VCLEAVNALACSVAIAGGRIVVLVVGKIRAFCFAAWFASLWTHYGCCGFRVKQKGFIGARTGANMDAVCAVGSFFFLGVLT